MNVDDSLRLAILMGWCTWLVPDATLDFIR
jgi:hypothetical protein